MVCPVCESPLALAEAPLRCGRGHTFDRAREGYVHLLPAGHGRSRIRGDTAPMVAARRRFLGRGHYQAVSDALNEIALDHLSRKQRPVVVDAGCGEGYYIGRLARAAGPGDASACFIGLDVSKHAVRLAARAHPDVLFYVTDVSGRTCVAAESVTLLLNVFAPRSAPEFLRILGTDGLAIVCIPEEDHLRELRRALDMIGIEEDKRDRTLERFSARFELIGERGLAFTARLSGQDVIDLLRMSPNYWHLEEEEIEQAGGLFAHTEVTVSVSLLALRPR